MDLAPVVGEGGEMLILSTIILNGWSADTC